MKIALVVATAENGVIGAAGDLAWKISDDLKWFKKITSGKPIIMGRKTFHSIGRALPDRDNIVTTRSASFAPKGVFVTRSIDGAISLGRCCAAARGVDEVCVIGGGEIYAQTLNQAQRIYLTRVAASIDGDVHFPAIDSQDWRETQIDSFSKSDHNEYACEMFILDRVR